MQNPPRPQVIPTTQRQNGLLVDCDKANKMAIIEWEMSDDVLMHFPGQARPTIRAHFREVFVTDGLAGGRRLTADCKFDEDEPQVTFLLSAPVPLPPPEGDQTIVLPDTLRAMSVRNQVNSPIVVRARGRIVAWTAVPKNRNLPGVINSFSADGSKSTVYFRASNMVNELGVPCEDSAVPVVDQAVTFTARTHPRGRMVVAHQVRAADGTPVRLRVVEPEHDRDEEEVNAPST